MRGPITLGDRVNKDGGERADLPPRKKPTFKIKVENGQRKNRKGAGFYIKTEMGLAGF